MRVVLAHRFHVTPAAAQVWPPDIAFIVGEAKSVCSGTCTATPAAGHDRPQFLQALLDYHQSACTAQCGALNIPADAMVLAFLHGPEGPALIPDSGKLSSSTAPAMFTAEGIGR